jgi:hypothetical protein
LRVNPCLLPQLQGMLDVSISVYIGNAIAGGALALYMIGLMFPSKLGDESHKIFGSIKSKSEALGRFVCDSSRDVRTGLPRMSRVRS